MDNAIRIVGCIIFIIIFMIIFMLFAHCVFYVDLSRVIVATFLILLLVATVFITLMFIDSAF